MIILRDKTFGRENHKKLSKDQQFLPDPRLVQFIGECQIEISATNKFGNDKRKLGPIDQHKVVLESCWGPMKLTEEELIVNRTHK